MIIKVCGIKEVTNYQLLSELDIDMIGINFYKPSTRYIEKTIFSREKKQMRAGVFVNATIEEIKSATKTHALDFAQLHGDEDVEFCKVVHSFIPVIKVFRITEDFRWSSITQFQFVKYYLFDTMTKNYGGSGLKFNWDHLQGYKQQIPFILSGGISSEDAITIKSIKHSMLAGVDINSRFEISPGIKDINLVKNFIKEFRN